MLGFEENRVVENNLEIDENNSGSESDSSGTLTPPLENMAAAAIPDLRVLPEKFSGLKGTQEIGDFLDAIDRAAQINNWGDAEKIALLPSLLSHVSLKWFLAQRGLRAGQNAWIVWADALRAAFNTNITERFDALESRKFKKGDSAEEFFYDMMILLDRYNPQATDDVRLHYLRKGLPEKIQDKINLLDPQTPAQFKAVLKRICKEQTCSPKNDKEIDSLDIKELQVELSEGLRQLRREMQDLKLRESRPPQNNYRYGTNRGYSPSRYYENERYPPRYENNYRREQSPSRGESMEILRSQGAIPRRVRFQDPPNNSNRAERTTTGRPRCFNCNNIGHLARNCQNPPDQNRSQGNGINRPASFRMQ